MNIKNLKHTAPSLIDCEYEHPQYGWIPFTASKDDTEEIGRLIYADAIAGLLGTISEITPEVIDLAALRQAKVTAIKAERDRRKFNGVQVSGKWLHTDTYSRTQWMAMVMMGASIPAIDWTTMDGTSVTTSQALAGAVFQGTAQLDAALFSYAKTLIMQVEAAADPATVDIVTGWPATFEPA